MDRRSREALRELARVSGIEGKPALKLLRKSKWNLEECILNLNVSAEEKERMLEAIGSDATVPVEPELREALESWKARLRSIQHRHYAILLIWIACFYLSSCFEFGLVYFLCSVIVALIATLRRDKRKRDPNELSAYSALNPNQMRLPGSQMDHPLSNMMLG